ncbi:hypothetical protein, partial [Flavobacterium sp. A45]|uniref:hypothetical protein n=1 Tax=Flavobacterium sp. A45 TaxID=1945862 RepID=UPI0009CFCFDE
YRIDLKETKTELKLAKGNLSTAIALHFEKEKDYVNAFFYFISASKGHGESSEEKKESNITNNPEKKHYETCITNLNLASKNLKKITTDPDKEKLKTKVDSVKKLMNDIHKLNEDEVKNLVSTIRYELLTLLA